VCVESDEDIKRFRKRSAPPSRHRVDEAELAVEIRRQRSYPNLYKVDRRDSKVEGESQMQAGTRIVDSTKVAAAPHTNDDQRN
jgi:hypothetical protein